MPIFNEIFMRHRRGGVLLCEGSLLPKILHGEFIHYVRKWSAKGWRPLVLLTSLGHLFKWDVPYDPGVGFLDRNQR